MPIPSFRSGQKKMTRLSVLASVDSLVSRMNRIVLSPGDIYWFDIDDDTRRGSEQRKDRPFVVVSRYGINKALKTVVAVPLTFSGASDLTIKHPSYRIRLPK